MNKAKQFSQGLEQFDQEVVDRLEQLGQELLEQVVIPFCERKRLRVSAGMGSVSFHPLDEPVWAGVDEEYRRHGLDELDEGVGLINPKTGRVLRGSAPVLELLGWPVLGAEDGLGAIVMWDYTPAPLSGLEVGHDPVCDLPG